MSDESKTPNRWPNLASCFLNEESKPTAWSLQVAAELDLEARHAEEIRQARKAAYEDAARMAENNEKLYRSRACRDLHYARSADAFIELMNELREKAGK